MAAAAYPPMLALIESGQLRPQDLVERVVGLAEAAVLLPGMDRAAPAGVTMIDPSRLDPCYRVCARTLHNVYMELA